MNLLSSSVIERNAANLDTIATWLPRAVLVGLLIALILGAGEALDWLRERKQPRAEWWKGNRGGDKG